MRILILSRNGELYSTKSLYNAARRRNHFVRIVDHTLCDIEIEKDANRVYFEGRALSGFDVVIPRIGYTVTQYGAAVVRQFEAMGVFTTLRSQALLKTRDKLSCLQILSSKGISVPKTVYSNSLVGSLDILSVLEKYPVILKLTSGTHGLGVLKGDDEKSTETMLETFYSLKQKVLIQEFVKEASGEDLRAIVIDGEVVASMVRKAPPGEFRSNLHRGGSAEVAILSEEETRTAIESAKILGLKVAGVDMLRSQRGPLVLEVNASPGLEGIETTTRVDVAKHVISFIERKAKSTK